MVTSKKNKILYGLSIFFSLCGILLLIATIGTQNWLIGLFGQLSYLLAWFFLTVTDNN